MTITRLFQFSQRNPACAAVSDAAAPTRTPSTTRTPLALLMTLMATGAIPAAAADFSVPDCDAIEQWAAKLKRGEMVAVTPKVKFSSLLRAELTEPLFGMAAKNWSHDDFSAAYKKMAECRKGAGKRHDKKAVIKLSQAAKMVGKGGSAMRRVDHFRDAATKEVKKIIGHPVTQEMPGVIEAAQAALRGEATNERLKVDPKLAYVAGNVSNLQRYYDYLTEQDRLDLIATLEAEKASTVAEAGAIDDEMAKARKTLATAPATQDGLRILQQLTQAPVLEKITMADASAFREAIQKRQNAIRAEMSRQQARQQAQAAAQARRPIDLSQRLVQLIGGDAVENVTLGGIEPGVSRDDAVATLKKKWKFDFKGGLSILNEFVATRQIFPQLKSERRNGGRVELGVLDNGNVGQIRYVEYYNAAVVNTTPQAWLTKHLGKPNNVRPAGNYGRILTWKDGDRRMQVLATNQIEEVWRMAGFEGELAISIWNEDYEQYLVTVRERCNETRNKSRSELTMSDTTWFALNCGLAGGSKEHLGI